MALRVSSWIGKVSFPSTSPSSAAGSEIAGKPRLTIKKELTQRVATDGHSYDLGVDKR